MESATWTCWSCGRWIASGASGDGENKPAGGLSLNGTGQLHVCKDCHTRMSVVDRVTLSAMLRDMTSGGLGLPALIDAATELCDNVCDAFEGKDEPKDEDDDAEIVEDKPQMEWPPFFNPGVN